MAKKIVTPEFRLSYTHLFEPRSMADGAKEKYSVSVLIPKSEKAFIKQINDEVAKIMAQDPKLKGAKKTVLKHPLRDGDEERESPEYEGHYFLSVSGTTQPLILDKDKNEIIDKREIYSGIYGRVSFNLFAFDKAGNKGVGCGLNAVQKTKDGESLGGSYTKDQAEQDFGDDLL